MESAFIFGQAGNLGPALGTGWSVEDNYAWAVGQESKLTLPLPGNGKPYVVRFTLHPLIAPGTKDRQRIVFLGGTNVLGRFEIKERTSIEFALPVALTTGMDRIELTLVHPDAMRPADFLPSDDTRWLALCFHSASLIQDDSTSASNGSSGLDRRLPTGIVAGNANALALARIAGALRPLRGKFRIHYIDTHPDLADTAQTRPPDALSSAAFCWLQIGVGRVPTVQALRSELPSGCPIRRFGIPEMSAFWPFLGSDPRARREGDLYVPARYRFGDRVASSIAPLTMADQLIFTNYERMAETEMPNLDALLAADVMHWKRMDSRCDVKLTPYLQRSIREERPFLSPITPGPALLRALAERLLDWPVITTEVDRAEPLTDLDAAMEGYTGRREELPIHPRIARHFGLTWWHPELTYRWHGDRLSFQDYILNYIRWAAWRP